MRSLLCRLIRAPNKSIEDWMLDNREAIASHIQEGFAQAERGELIDGDAVIAMLRRRRAQRLKAGGMS